MENSEFTMVAENLLFQNFERKAERKDDRQTTTRSGAQSPRPHDDEKVVSEVFVWTS